MAAAALLASLLFSGRLRALLRVQLSKHFFSYRYDYREEWLKFTGALAGLNEDVAEGIIRIMAASPVVARFSVGGRRGPAPAAAGTLGDAGTRRCQRGAWHHAGVAVAL